MKIAFLGIAIFGPMIMQAQIAPEKQDSLKIAFVLNLLQFSEWPSQSFADTTTHFIIGVAGKSRFVNMLQKATHDQSFKDKRIRVEHYPKTNSIKSCHILIVDPTDPRHIRAILSKTKGKHIVTVSDAENFTSLGGIIGLFMERNKVEFEVNIEAARAERINLSSKLLRLAKICYEDSVQ